MNPNGFPIDFIRLSDYGVIMKQTSVPLGPLGRIVSAADGQIIGKCVGTFWPFSGSLNQISLKLRTSTGAIHEVPFFSTKDATFDQRQEFLTGVSQKST